MIQTRLVKEKTYRLPYVRLYENGKDISYEEERKRRIEKLIKEEDPPKYIVAFLQKNTLRDSYTEDFDITLNRELREIGEVREIQYRFVVDGEGYQYREALVIY